MKFGGRHGLTVSCASCYKIATGLMFLTRAMGKKRDTQMSLSFSQHTCDGGIGIPYVRKLQNMQIVKIATLILTTAMGGRAYCATYTQQPSTVVWDPLPNATVSPGNCTYGNQGGSVACYEVSGYGQVNPPILRITNGPNITELAKLEILNRISTVISWQTLWMLYSGGVMTPDGKCFVDVNTTVNECPGPRPTNVSELHAYPSRKPRQDISWGTRVSRPTTPPQDGYTVRAWDTEGNMWEWPVFYGSNPPLTTVCQSTGNGDIDHGQIKTRAVSTLTKTLAVTCTNGVTPNFIIHGQQIGTNPTSIDLSDNVANSILTATSNDTTSGAKELVLESTLTGTNPGAYQQSVVVVVATQ
ncbi:Uncharacterised protein [Salmonella enterica subsp. houtenae]|nr:Uncharacterised protein [Salmonella enterica subsp. houtenae]